MAKQFEKPKMVPVPSRAIVPERDVDKSPILECSHLGIDPVCRLLLQCSER